MVMEKMRSFWNHPAGPKTVFFWAPTMKWGIIAANINDFSKPVDNLSYPQQLAVTLTGVIWMRYSTQIIPINYNLMTVNAVMAVTGSYQLMRKITSDYGEKKVEA
ncbi:Mitochondrial pyruvate carrier 4 [Cymbomonas tetramitiformis]|uniref:Mitochondrial pyruvate carrier n=1 Tax=Cymbomonas tetramitiformis TaxID=36881 RepID=A0AAE0LAZ5_9CHLO|nr:Mitochondrial pyruvate carrier 4 [Cymbomonas tetramitiformis]